MGIQQGCFPFDVSWNAIDGGGSNSAEVKAPTHRDSIHLRVQIRSAEPRGT